MYLNVAGGFRISEPAADLAVAASLTSALYGLPLPGSMAIFGEVGLSGEIRAVSQMAARLKEASKLGFTQVLCPHWRGKVSSNEIKLRELSGVGDLIALFPDQTTASHRAAII